jgi:hypothetical protein
LTLIKNDVHYQWFAQMRALEFGENEKAVPHRTEMKAGVRA